MNRYASAGESVGHEGGRIRCFLFIYFILMFIIFISFYQGYQGTVNGTVTGGDIKSFASNVCP